MTINGLILKLNELVDAGIVTSNDDIYISFEGQWNDIAEIQYEPDTQMLFISDWVDPDA